MKRIIYDIGERMIKKMEIINEYCKEWATDEKRFKESRPLNKFDHELRGMTQLLASMGVDFEFYWNEDLTEYRGITINGINFNIQGGNKNV